MDSIEKFFFVSCFVSQMFPYDSLLDHSECMCLLCFWWNIGLNWLFFDVKVDWSCRKWIINYRNCVWVSVFFGQIRSGFGIHTMIMRIEFDSILIHHNHSKGPCQIPSRICIVHPLFGNLSAQKTWRFLAEVWMHLCQSVVRKLLLEIQAKFASFILRVIIVHKTTSPWQNYTFCCVRIWSIRR